MGNSPFREACRTLSGLIASLEGLDSFMEDAARLLSEALTTGNRIFFCGNGGSAADAQHLAAELVVRLRGDRDRAGLPGLALTTDSSVLTACANDFGFEFVFSRQLEALGRAGDVLVALSTSGRSANILRGLETAAATDMRTVFLTGDSAGSGAADVIIRVPSGDCNRIQEAHVFLGHQLIRAVEDRLRL